MLTSQPSDARHPRPVHRPAAGALAVTLALLAGGCGGASPFETPAATPALPGAPSGSVSAPAATADPARGERLFAALPAPGLLACMDCHSDDPLTKNFGNIWVGRNATALIERAVSANTGGMGYFSRYLSPADFADIAAYLGNTPQAVRFGSVSIASAGATQVVTVRASTKTAIDTLAVVVEGEFARSGGDCGASLARFATCTIELRFAPRTLGPREGSLLIQTGDPQRPVRIPLSGAGIARRNADPEVRHA